MPSPFRHLLPPALIALGLAASFALAQTPPAPKAPTAPAPPAAPVPAAPAPAPGGVGAEALRRHRKDHDAGDRGRGPPYPGRERGRGEEGVPARQGRRGLRQGRSRAFEGPRLEDRRRRPRLLCQGADGPALRGGG